MLTVEEAQSEIRAAGRPLASETTSLENVFERVLAADVRAVQNQPPFDLSAMDGYAVKFADLTNPEKPLRVIGLSSAGEPFPGRLNDGEAVRIFTGAEVPPGADHILIQEDAIIADGAVTAANKQSSPSFIRRSGRDFSRGDIVLEKGRRLSARDLALAAAAGAANLEVVRKPRVGIFETGDELVEPGQKRGNGSVFAANRYAVSALISAWGGAPVYLGRLPDSRTAIADGFRSAEVDAIVPIGGASVGDRDFVKPAFLDAGGEIRFERVAVRPGKPTWLGHLDDRVIVGLPGNPVSAIICAHLFVCQLIESFLGLVRVERRCVDATCETTAPANGARETYLRARSIEQHGRKIVEIAADQDSSLLKPLSLANCLLRRKPNAPPIERGDAVEILVI